MAYSQDDLDAIDAAIKEGVSEVEYKDKKVVYRSLKEMMQIRGMIARAVGLVDASASRIYPTLSKGFKRGFRNQGE